MVSIHKRFKIFPTFAVSLLLCILVFSGQTARADASGDQTAAVERDSRSVVGAYRVLLAGFGNPFMLAEEDTQPGASAAAGEGRETPSVAAYGKAFLPDLVDGTRRIFNADIARVALIGLAATGVAFAFDQTVDEYFQKHEPINQVSHYGDSWGQVYVPFGLGVALFATGEIIDDKHLADTGVVAVEALAVTGVATEALKYLTHRERPNYQDNMSFPSGHASLTTAFAASVSEMYDWNPWIAAPLFSAALFVSASRIQDNMHHFSDVVAGMTLGTVVGMSFGRSHKEKNAAETAGNVSITPLIDGTYQGIVLNWRF